MPPDPKTPGTGEPDEELEEDDATGGTGDEGADDAEDDAAGAGEDGGPGGEEDDGGDDEGDGAGSDQVDAGRRRVATPRENETIRKLREEKQESDRRLAALENKFNGQTTAAQRAQDEALERERLALMDPDQKLEYQTNKIRQEVRQELNAQNFRTMEHADKQSFDMLVQSNPVARRHQAEVEKRLSDARTSGYNFPRITVLKQIIGERAWDKQAQTGGKANARAERERERNRASGGSPRGDRQSDRRRESGGNDASARAKRLENTPL